MADIRIEGIPNVEILKQAHISSARVNGTDDLRGSIKVGNGPVSPLSAAGPCTEASLEKRKVVVRQGSRTDPRNGYRQPDSQ